VEVVDPKAESDPPRSIHIPVLVDDEDRIVETGPALPVDPEDDELFRLLEERS
jgi:hypothetical protein